MSEEMNDANFEALLEDSLSDIGPFEPGQQIETTVVSLAGDTIFLQLSGKSEGVLEAAEMLDKEGNLTVKEGDTIKVFFLEAKNGELRFTTRISGNAAGQAVLENAYNSGIPVEGVVVKEIKGGFEVTIGDSRAFCPYSQMGLRRIENPAEWVGRHLTFKIMEHGENGRNILVSHRMILEEEQKAQVEKLKKTLSLGAVVKGTVKQLQNFGAFVDLNGLQALLPISEISRTRVEDISAVLSVGQEIEAKIINLDWANERISLSLKALLPDPWDTARETYKKGTRHKGKVVRITNFGAFVNLEPGLDGLIPLSDLKGDTDSRDVNPRDFVKTGETLDVVINNLDIERKRISLKLASSFSEEESMKKYLDDQGEGDSETYNPFAAFFKDKK
jgi:small subunit ribosomal protein S1